MRGVRRRRLDGVGRILCVLAVAALFAPVWAMASDQQNADPSSVAAREAETQPQTLWERDTLTGDWGGARPRLIDSGVTLGLTEISEVLGNVSGGQQQGFDYMGRTELAVDFDLEKLLGWNGALIHANGYQIHGRGLGCNNLGGNYSTPSNIEATRTTRLFDLYLEQSLFDGKLSIRLGQIAADDEFLTSQYAGTFINGTFGWAGIMAADLPSGGPAYPLATPGVRVKYAPTEALSWQTAVFNGDPAGSPLGNDDPQIRNRSGTTFSTNRDLLVFSEVAYTIAADKDNGIVPATFKIGGWYHSGRFDDQRYDTHGEPFNVSGGDPDQHRNNYGLYGVIDQMLFSKSGTGDQGLAGFVRLGGAPDDRNVISFYADAGLNYMGPFEGRGADIIGIAFSYAKIGSAAIDSDKDYNRAYPTATRPVRDYEAAIELTYVYAVAPWWIIQPDIQYIIHPAGSVACPIADLTKTATAMENAFIFGVRTGINF